MPVDTVETRRGVTVALRGLDTEAFAFVVDQLWQRSTTAGGFVDKAGWERVRLACEEFFPELKEAR